MRQVREPPPLPYPLLSAIPCRECGELGVTVVAMLHASDQEPEERCYCTPDCARNSGWPWLRPDIIKPRPRRAS
jgi:hypothetical protein